MLSDELMRFEIGLEGYYNLFKQNAKVFTTVFVKLLASSGIEFASNLRETVYCAKNWR